MFYPTLEATSNAAMEALAKNPDHYFIIGQFHCNCGESFTIELVRREDDIIVDEFVWCETCFKNYEND